MGGTLDTAAEIAGRQHGRVAWWQLVRAGVDRHVIQRWLVDGRLHRVHHGAHASRHAFELDVARRRRSNHIAYACGDVVERSGATAADRRRRLGAPPR